MYRGFHDTLRFNRVEVPMGLHVILALAVTASVFDDPSKRDADKTAPTELEGTWKVLTINENGQDAPQELIRNVSIIFAGNKMRSLFGDFVTEETYTVNATTSPKTIDLTETLLQAAFNGPKPAPPKRETRPGIYVLQDKKLKICLAEPGQERPKDFKSQRGAVLFVLERDASGSAASRIEDLRVVDDIRRQGADAFFAGSGPIEHQQLYVTIGRDKGDTELTNVAPLLKKLKSKMIILHLQESMVTDAGLSHLAGINNIFDINLTKTRLTNTGLQSLKEMTHLRGLDVTGTKVTDDGINRLKQALSRLTVVKLNSAQEAAEEAIIKAGGQIGSTAGGSVIEVHFRGVAMTDTDLGNLKAHLDVWKATLKTLDVADTKITDAGLEHLRGLIGLKTLDVSGTGVTAAGAKSLEKSLPGLEVKR
jgi:uncharacterized protein (TIGR03067 family)